MWQSTEPRAGRPKASSRETLAEAACELFLEQGFEATSIADITTPRRRQPLELLQLLLVEVRHPLGGSRRADRGARAAPRRTTRDRMPRPPSARRPSAIADGVRARQPRARASSTPTAMGLEAELERELGAPPGAHRAGGRRHGCGAAARTASTPRSPARRGPAPCSPRSRRGRTTAPDARRSRGSSPARRTPAAPSRRTPGGRGASAARRRAGAGLRRGARVLPRRRRDAAGRGVRGRRRRARGDPRRRPRDARARRTRRRSRSSTVSRPTAMRRATASASRSRSTTPPPRSSASTDGGRRGRGIRSRDAVALAQRAPARSGRAAAHAVPGARGRPADR